MTEKELLYLEDAISHEQNIIKIINNNINNLENDDLITFMNNELNIHNKRKELLINLLKEKANGW